MGKEEEIQQLLLEGRNPQELIQMGYKKPTVYKIQGLFKKGSIREINSPWFVENIMFSQDRYLPSQSGSVTFELRNISDTDLYVYRVGIQPEWLKEEWIQIDSRVLLHPNEKRVFTIGFTIPGLGLPLGEYGIRFGLDGQYLYPSTRGIRGEQYIQWSEPVFINIKMPATGYKVFVSHSTKDMFLIRQLEKYLDCYGVDVVIAEDIRSPGMKLDEKFYGLIRESHLLIAILSKNGLNSEWVIQEINYAGSIQKPIIPLVEANKDFKVQMNIEYITFSNEEPIDSIITKIIEGFNNIRERQLILPQPIPHAAASVPFPIPLFIPLLIGGTIGLVVGLLMAGSSTNSSKPAPKSKDNKTQ